MSQNILYSFDKCARDQNTKKKKLNEVIEKKY